MAIALKPDLADAYFNKAAVLERSGHQEEARRAYNLFIRHALAGTKAQIEQARSKLR